MGSSEDIGSVAELNVGRRRLESFLRRKRRFIALLAAALVAGSGAWAIGIVAPAQAKAGITLDQCANLGTTCDTAHPEQWQHGNLNANNSRYLEGESVAYRAVMTDLAVGATYAITIEWDTTQSGKHAIDYLTSFDRSVQTADPCMPSTCGATAELAIPLDPNVAAAGVTEVSDRMFSVFGASFPTAGQVVNNDGDLCATATCTIAANPSPHTRTGSYADNSQTSITVYVTASSDTVVLAWGGHIAERRDWGTGKSAVSLPGSPYHMRIIGLGCSDTTNCGAGNQDRSLSSEAVVYGASITVIKEASIEGSAAYDFVAAPAPLTNFSLVDDGTTANTKTFGNIVSFGMHTITEMAGNDFRLSSADCTVADPNGGRQTPINGGVEIDIREGEIVTCIFRNTVTGPMSIDLEKTASPTTFDEVDDAIVYTYTITNNGDIPLGPAQFTVTDDHIANGTPFPCGAAATTLAPGSSVSCTANYAVTSADLDSATVTNKATASGAGVTSPLRTATITAVVVPPTTTTTSTTTTTTTIAPTTTVAPTTIAPTTTVTPTTVAPSTTTGPTTTFTANVVTTTVPSSTTPSTTTTTTPSTTAAPEFQALLQPTTTTAPVESDFLVLFPDELPNTGPRFNVGFLFAALALLVVGALIGFLNVRTNGSTRKERKI